MPPVYLVSCYAFSKEYNAVYWFFHYVIIFISLQMKKPALPAGSFTWWSIGESNPWPRQCECRALPTALIPRVLSCVIFRVLPVNPGAFFRHAVLDVKTDDCCGAYAGGLRPTNCANTPCAERSNSIACPTEKCKGP